MSVNFIALETVSSTNTWAKQHLDQFSRNTPTVIVAQEQTQGRGRMNRSWFSPRGKNLYFTLCEARRLPSALSYVQAAALSVHELLHYFSIPARIRWPNDLYVEDKKISGILIELVPHAAKEMVVVGIGINVNMNKNDLQTLDRPVTSIAMCREDPISLLEVQERLTKILTSTLDKGEKDPLFLYGAWKNECAWMLKTQAPLPHDGIIEDITADGRLKVRSPDGSFTLLSMI